MKSGFLLVVICGFAQAAFAGWTFPPPLGGERSPGLVHQVNVLWPPAPGTGGWPTPPPKVIQISDQQDATYCGQYVEGAYKTLVEEINNKSCPAKLISATVTFEGVRGDGINAEEVYQVEGKTTCMDKDVATLSFRVDDCDLNQVSTHLAVAP